MATFYVIRCPKCGNVFDLHRGVTMSWDFSKPVPVELREETPFSCPECNHTMCVKDDNFHDNVLKVIHGD